MNQWKFYVILGIAFLYTLNVFVDRTFEKNYSVQRQCLEVYHKMRYVTKINQHTHLFIEM